jgi:hypothetical protein
VGRIDRLVAKEIISYQVCEIHITSLLSSHIAVMIYLGVLHQWHCRYPIGQCGNNVGLMLLLDKSLKAPGHGHQRPPKRI